MVALVAGIFIPWILFPVSIGISCVFGSLGCCSIQKYLAYSLTRSLSCSNIKCYRTG